MQACICFFSAACQLAIAGVLFDASILSLFITDQCRISALVVSSWSLHVLARLLPATATRERCTQGTDNVQCRCLLREVYTVC